MVTFYGQPAKLPIHKNFSRETVLHEAAQQRDEKARSNVQKKSGDLQLTLAWKKRASPTRNDGNYLSLIRASRWLGGRAEKGRKSDRGKSGTVFARWNVHSHSGVSR